MQPVLVAHAVHSPASALAQDDHPPVPHEVVLVPDLHLGPDQALDEGPQRRAAAEKFSRLGGPPLRLRSLKAVALLDCRATSILAWHCKNSLTRCWGESQNCNAMHSSADCAKESAQASSIARGS